jgi:hypothetical protein
MYIDGGSNPISNANPPTVDDSETPFVVPFLCQESGALATALMVKKKKKNIFIYLFN